MNFLRKVLLALAPVGFLGCETGPVSSVDASSGAQPTTSYAVNSAIDDDVVSVFVTYRANAPTDRLQQIMQRGARLAGDIARRRVIVAELPRTAVAILPSLDWVEDIEVGTDDNFPASETLPWGVDSIDAEQVHPSGYNGFGVKVAIIDAGINCYHTDLYPTYAYGYDFVTMQWFDWDYKCLPEWHGTAVAGIIGARRDNGVAVIGVAPAAKLYSLRVCFLNCTDARIVLALDFATTLEMDVVNISLANCGAISGGVEDAIEDAYNGGVVIVAAGGNGEHAVNPCAPNSPVSGIARQPEVIAVSAMKVNGDTAAGFQYGPEIELAAPTDVLTTKWDDNNGIIGFSGTSAAAPRQEGI